MNSLRLGTSGPIVSALGLGCMGMSDLYGPAERGESLATLRAAIEAAVPPGAAAGTRYATAQMGMLDSER